MWLDLKFALRLLLKNPSYALISIAAIAVGVSTATSQFAFFSGILLRPLPQIRDENRVVKVKCFREADPANEFGVSQPTFLDIRERAQTLEGLTIVDRRTMIISGGEQAERVLGSWISATGFQMLGALPVLGRNFRPEEDSDEAPAVAILSHGLWQRSFGGAAGIIGQSITLNGEPVTVVGVMPEGFRFPDVIELWMPFRYARKETARADFNWQIYARIRDGVSLARTQTELSTLASQFAKEFPILHTGLSLRVTPLRFDETRDVRTLMFLMLGSVFAVMLIACGNVANLMLAKSASRSREIAVRLALGATRGAIARQVILESMLLCLIGGGLGILLAMWKIDVVLAMLPTNLPYWIRFDMDWRVVAFSLTLALLSSLVAGFLPALQTSRADLSTELKEGARGSTATRETTRLRSILVVAQLAIALVLLVGAGLLVRSFLKLQSSDPGCDPENVLTFRVGLPPTQFKDTDFVRRFWSRALARLGEIPGVEASGFISALPGTRSASFGAIYVEGRPLPKTVMEAIGSYRRNASPGVFPALRIPLVKGRLFTDEDTAESPRVALVDAAFAEQVFPGEDPLGKRVSFGTPDEPKRVWCTIVGIVGNVRQVVERILPERSVWLPLAQDDDNHFSSGVVRVKGGDPNAFARYAQDAVFAAQENIPIYDVLPMTEVLRQSMWQKRFFARLFISFAVTALFLAAIGVYGVMSYAVVQRTSEIGVRMALGAQPGDVVRMILRQGLWLVAGGILVGLAASFAVAHLLAAYLYRINPYDPPTFAFVPILLGAVAILACWIPSRRATRILPIVALRSE